VGQWLIKFVTPRNLRPYANAGVAPAVGPNLMKCRKLRHIKDKLRRATTELATVKQNTGTQLSKTAKRIQVHRFCRVTNRIQTGSAELRTEYSQTESAELQTEYSQTGSAELQTEYSQTGSADRKS
jgi:hypothetical protein